MLVAFLWVPALCLEYVVAAIDAIENTFVYASRPNTNWAELSVIE